MNREQASTLIKQTFTQSFDKTRFRDFAINLLNDLDESKAFASNITYIKDAFKDHVSRYERLGTYTSPNGEKLDVLIVHLTTESKLERARTAIRNFAADYLVTRGEKEAALVAFVSPAEADWRFSLVKMEYATVKGDDGKVKVATELTPARRYSFLVGSNEASHTAQAQLVDILADTENNPSLTDLEEAFSVERVTDEFFEQYKQLFLDAKDSLDKVLSRDARIRGEFESKDINTVDFVKKLLGQIVFLYFLQKKGWFGVERDAMWGTGPKNFLRQLLENTSRIKRGNFFNDILEPLFYEALARERDDDFYSRFNCKIPFLNGGLFEPLNDYDWVHTDIRLPDTLFSNDVQNDAGDEGTGILDVFDRYNFTVAEDEPLEREVAIDPEFLGKVFEKLNAVNQTNFDRFRAAERSGQRNLIREFNRQYGVFYTPREIVHFMCQRSLVSYLETELASKIPKDAIETFIRVGDRSADFEARPTQRHEDKLLPPSIRDNAALIAKKLEDIRVCDPAIGSGAFLVGMMHEIVRTHLALSALPDMPKRQSYELKRHVIQNCLFGVDIDPGAVEIAKLRLWLSLVVDEHDVKQIKPLPNLDFKIMQGNSLLDEFEGVKLFDDRLLDVPGESSEAERQAIKQRLAHLSTQYISLHQAGKLNPVKKLEINRDIEQQKTLLKTLGSKQAAGGEQGELSDKFSEARRKVEQLSELHKEFFDVPSGKRKKELRRQLDALEWEFMEATLKERKKPEAVKELQKLRRASVKPFFLWKLQFMGVFQERGGFDVVIMNPPYGAAFTEAEKELLKQKYEHIAERIRNSFLYFTGLGYDLVKDRGVACLILPNEFLFQIYMTKARRFFVTNSQVLFAINTGEDVFEAIVPTSIIALKKVTLDSYEIPVADLRDCTRKELSRRLDVGTFAASSSDIVLKTPNSIFSFDLKSTSLVNKLSADFVPFGEFCEDVANGISTSCDEVYIVPSQIAKRESFEELYLKQCIRGGQFNRFYCPARTAEYVLYVTDDFDRKAGGKILQYLSQHRALLIRKSVEKKNGNREWHVLFRGRYEGLFKKPKIIIRQTADSIVAAPDTEVGYYCIDSVNVALLKETALPRLKLFIGLLNSSLLNFFYREISQEGGRVLAQVKPQRIRSLPIAEGSPGQQAAITKLVDRILAAKRRDPEADTTALEQEIDRLVYALYGLTPAETKLVQEATG
jgi:type I restriction-modification system DNA methylase subunit